MATNYHTLFFGAGFLIFFLLAILFILPLTIYQLIKVFKPATRAYGIFSILIGICTSLACIFFGFTIIMISVFSFIPYYAAALIITAFMIAIFLAFKPWQPGFFRKRGNLYLIGLLVVMFIVTWIVAALTRDACVTSSPTSVSVWQTRKNSGDMCAKEAPKPCHVYLTFGTNASTSVIVHFHASKAYTNPGVLYSVDSSMSLQQTAVSYKMDLEINRYVYYAELSGLTPGESYNFIAGDTSDPNSLTANKRFKTAPASGSFTFITGGDLGTSTRTPMLIKAAAALNPIYMALGGDLAYANAMRSCYQRWDTFLKLYEDNAVTPGGLMIPVVAAVGNHEAGGFDQPLSRLRFYTRYFVQEALNNRLPSELPTHHVQYISNQVMVSLDSTVIETPASQVAWLTDTLSSAPAGSFKTAIYHAPAYPSIRSFNNAESKSVRTHFVPVFDQTNLAVSFENHDHAYKRTNRMRDSQNDPTGTLYIGDGAMGVSPRISTDPPIPSDKQYLVKYQGRSFFLHVSVNAGNYSMNAIDENGVTFDSISDSYP